MKEIDELLNHQINLTNLRMKPGLTIHIAITHDCYLIINSHEFNMTISTLL